MNAIQDLMAQGQDQLYDPNKFTKGTMTRNRVGRDRAGSAQSKRANRIKSRVASGRNLVDDFGLVTNQKRGIRGTMPGGMVDAGGGIPSRDIAPDPTPARSGNPLVGSGFAQDLIDAANKNKSFGDSVDAGKTLTSAPSRHFIQEGPGPTPSTAPPPSTSSGLRSAGYDPEKFAAAKERRKREKDLARQRQFSRAQMKSGFMFNEDGSADLLGSMAAQSFEQNPSIAGLMAAARQQGHLGAEENEVSRLMAQEQVNQGEFGRSDRALDHQKSLLETQVRPDLLQAQSAQQRAEFETDLGSQIEMLKAAGAPDRMRAQTADELAEFQMSDAAHQRQMELAGIDPAREMDRLLRPYQQFSKKFADDPEGRRNIVLAAASAAQSVPAEMRSQVAARFGIPLSAMQEVMEGLKEDQGVSLWESLMGRSEPVNQAPTPQMLSLRDLMEASGADVPQTGSIEDLMNSGGTAPTQPQPQSPTRRRGGYTFRPFGAFSFMSGF